MREAGRPAGGGCAALHVLPPFLPLSPGNFFTTFLQLFVVNLQLFTTFLQLFYNFLQWVQ